MSEASILNRIPSRGDYPAAQQVLDEMTGAAKVAAPVLPVWGLRHEPPALPKVEHELKLACGNTLHVSEAYSDHWYASLAVGGYVETETIDAAKPLAVQLVIDRLERTLADLRAYQEHVAGKGAQP